MNQSFEELVKQKAVVFGRIINENGFIVFQREDDIKKLNEIPEVELGFATLAMGRAVFQILPDGKIINYKGVDSHLENEESASKNLVGAKTAYISRPNKSYRDSMYPLNLVIFPGNRADMRIRGASPLEDLEIEADINSKMQGNGIKLPRIKVVREFTEEFALKYGLPIKVRGDLSEFKSDYKQEDLERKHRLMQNGDLVYHETVESGKRPESLREYFKRTGMYKNPELLEFAQANGFGIENFVQNVDSSYSLGQRYGQTERHLQNPFRISDIEYYIKMGRVDIIKNIVTFSESVQETNETMENYFARQMGTNLANMLNSGWICENFAHRQDFTLAGEMCDDTYKYFPEEFEYAKKYDDGKRKAVQKELRSKYICQIFALSSTIKVLQDEMILRKKSPDEIKGVYETFIKTFVRTVDLDKVTEVIHVDAKKIFGLLAKTPQNFLEKMAEKQDKSGVSYDKEILQSHQNNKGFFNQVSASIVEGFGIKEVKKISREEELR